MDNNPRQRHARWTQLTRQELKQSIKQLFIDLIEPGNVLDIFEKYDANILTSSEKERVRAVTEQRGDEEGAALLLDLLSQYQNWYPCLRQVLKDPKVNKPDLVDLLDETIDFVFGERDVTNDQDHQIEMTNEPSRRTINIILVGGTGAGKSSTGNSMLSKKAFKTSSNFSSETHHVQYDYTEFKNHKVKVVDTPGYLDTDVNAPDKVKEFTSSLRKALAITPEGYNAIVLVLSAGHRYTAKDIECLQTLRKILGPKFVENHAVLLMSRGDTLFEENDDVTFEKWCGDQTGPFAQLYKECQKRAVLFDNRTPSEETKLQQMTQLMQTIDSMSRGNRPKSLVFQMTSKASKMYLEKAMGKIEAEEIVRELAIVIDYLSLVNPATRKQDIYEAEWRLSKLRETCKEYSQAEQAIVEDVAGLIDSQRYLSGQDTDREIEKKLYENVSEVQEKFCHFKMEQIRIKNLEGFNRFLQCLFDLSSGLRKPTCSIF